MAEVLEHVAAHGAEVMVATHNQASIEATVALMGQLGIEPAAPGVSFGQLLGMADHLTFTLGRNSYRVSEVLKTPPGSKSRILSPLLVILQHIHILAQHQPFYGQLHIAN